MTTPDQSKGDRSRDEVLAGEYVLGVLGADERARVEERLRHDRPFAAMVRRWERNLSRIDDGYGAERRRSPVVLPRFDGPAGVAADLSFSGFAESLWNSLSLWRSLALAGFAAFAAFVAASAGLWPFRAADDTLLAEMTLSNSALDLSARYDRATGKIRLSPATSRDAAPKSLELWLLEGGDGAASLGVLPADGRGDLLVPVELRDRLVEKAVLAVSMEPYGGSLTGKMTGPVVAKGVIHSRP